MGLITSALDHMMPKHSDLKKYEEDIKKLPKFEISRGLNAAASSYLGALASYELGNSTQGLVKRAEDNMKTMFNIYEDELGEFSDDGVDRYFGNLTDFLVSENRRTVPQDLTVEEILSGNPASN